MDLQLTKLDRTAYFVFFFFFNDTATTEIYTLSLHDALPIFPEENLALLAPADQPRAIRFIGHCPDFVKMASKPDRKSTRLNSSHPSISYAVFCLKKKKQPLLCSPQTTSGARSARRFHLRSIT